MIRSLLVILVMLVACSDSPAPVAPDAPMGFAALSEGSPASFFSFQRPTDGINVLVRMKDGVPRVSEEEAAEIAGAAEVTYVFKQVLNGFRVQVPDQNAIEVLSQHPEVEYVTTGDSDIGTTVQSNPGWALDILDERSNYLDQTYEYYENGAGVHVFVLDTGIDGNHPDLINHIATTHVATWTEPVDPYQDCHGHGTAVSAVAVSAKWGVAKNAIIHPMQVLDCSKTGNVIDVANAVDVIVNWVKTDGIWPAVINYSAGGGAGLYEPHEEAMRNAVAAGVPVIVSAGNDNVDACDRAPARVAEVITVGAMDGNFDRRFDSNWGQCVDLFAPGTFVATASVGGGATTSGGTSLASPLVAGTVALILGDPSVASNDWRTVLLGGTTMGALSWGSLGSGSPNLLLNAPYTQVRVVGPWAIYEQGIHSWSAQAYGGDHSYTYQWQIKFVGQSGWTTLTGETNSTYSRNVMLGEADFTLRVLTVSAGEQVSGELFVDNVIGCDGPGGC